MRKSVTSIQGLSIIYSVFVCPAQLREDSQRRHKSLVMSQILLLFLTNEKVSLLILPQLHYIMRSKKI